MSLRAADRRGPRGLGRGAAGSTALRADGRSTARVPECGPSRSRYPPGPRLPGRGPSNPRVPGRGPFQVHGSGGADPPGPGVRQLGGRGPSRSTAPGARTLQVHDSQGADARSPRVPGRSAALRPVDPVHGPTLVDPTSPRP